MGLIGDLFKTAAWRNLPAAWFASTGKWENIDSVFAHDGRGKLG